MAGQRDSQKSPFARALITFSIAAVMPLAGCVPSEQKALRASAESLEQGDYGQAIILANDVIEEQPTGPSKAEALYLRGRAYEQHPITSQGQLQANMQAARSSYIEALKSNPSAKLVTYIRASMGKVALYQDDFPTAIQQLTAAYNSLEDVELKAATLYHLGKAQQRSGQFALADSTLLAVVQRYPKTQWAQKAQETRGSRGFYVQLAVYSNPAQADAASKVVRNRGFEPKRFLDSQGRQLLRTGPYSSYEQAKQMREKTMDIYADATIVP